jgi:intein/homing endonuclease
LRLLLIPGTKIIIVGAAFRQAKIIFEYMEAVWNKADILRSVCDTHSGPRRDIDRCTIYINDSVAHALPLGTGEKIRGMRAHVIIGDEFNCSDKNTLVETDKGLIRIKDLMDRNDFNVINKDGELELPERNIKTPPCDVYEIKTKYGYSFKCSENHVVMTQKGWKKAVELNDKDYIICDNKYKFPEEQVDIVDENLAWIMGVLVSEGYLNNKNYFTITSTDEEFIDRCACALNKVNLYHKVYTRDGYKDKRGWVCKRRYDIYVCNTKFRQKLLELGLDFVTAHDKKIPWSILQSPRNIIVSFLSGLFEGDGSCFTFKTRDHNNILGTAYYTVSEILAQDLHTLLLKFDIICLRQTRKSKISDNPQWMLRMNGEYALALVNLLNIKLWKDIAERGYVHKRKDTYGTIYLKEENRYRASLPSLYGKRNYRIGQYKTQEEAIQKVKETLDNNPRGFRVKSVTKLPEQEQLYDFHLPKTHSFYGNGFVQHNSIPPDIYETVIAGFAAVSSDPVGNVKEMARRKAMMDSGVWTEEAEGMFQMKGGNQAVLSGTAGYGFQHFAEYWRRYKSIIESRGDIRKLKEIFGEDEIPESFNWRDYSVIRIPYELIPKGFMDDKHVMRARATVHSAIFCMEYSTVFSDDSDGFFKRSLIESCVANIKNVGGGAWPPWCPHEFDAEVRGNRLHQYVYGVDPASEQDNFSVVIMELHQEHSRIVYTWSTSRKDFKQRLSAGLTKEHDFYGFCVRKIRDLMTIFPCKAIALDAQGGGIAVEEALHDPDKLAPGEIAIWPVIEDDKEKDTDIQPGLHILHICQFARADWTAEANHGLRKDFEDKVLLFPRFDPITLELSIEEDKRRQLAFERVNPDKKFNIYDTLEDCVMEIEELKNELCTITMTRTGTGVGSRDRWDTPEIKMPNGKKGRLRKDRYSALVMCNMISRTIQRAPLAQEYDVIGGARGDIGKQEGQMYYGPDWFVRGMNDGIVCGVSRR